MTNSKPKRRPLLWFQDARKHAMCHLAYFSMRLYGCKPDFESIVDDTYSNKSHTDRNLDNAKDLDGLLAVAKDCLKVATERRTTVSDKCKTLLTLSSLLLGFVGALLPKQLAFDDLCMRLMVFLSVLALLNTVALLIVFFGVGRDVVIRLEQDEVNLEKDDLKKSLINAYLQCQITSDCRTDYLVDLYKTARFFFLTAFSVVVLLFSVNFFLRSENAQSKQMLSELRADPKLVEILRGPNGDKGDQRAPAQKTVQGESGETGTVDVDAIANRLINDKRMKTLLEAIVKRSKEEEQPKK